MGNLPPQSLTWRAELESWCRAFGAQLNSDWSPANVSTLFEGIESFASLVDLLAAREAADAAAAMAVYLCAFVDTDLVPDAHQRARMRDLVDALARSVDATVAQPMPEWRNASPHAFRVLHLRDEQDDALDGALIAAIAAERMVVTSLGSVGAASDAFDRGLPDAVLLPADRIDALRTMLDAAARHGTAASHRVLWAVVGLDADLTLRLHARRAGADVVLPKAQPERAATLLATALQRRRDSAYRVLVVEDDRGQAMFCESLLHHQGFVVDVAPDATAAQMFLSQNTPDLILVDIHLPDLDGIQLTQRIREQSSFAHVPIVFLTGEDDLDRRAEAMAAGGDDFLSKPVRPRHLIAHVNSRIDRARQLAHPPRSNNADDELCRRLDRVRFVEALERVRRMPSTHAAVAVIGMRDVNAIAARLGFVRAGELALQLGDSIQSRYGMQGRSCSLGEFSHLILLQATSEEDLRRHAEDLRVYLGSRKWHVGGVSLTLGFTVGTVRYGHDGQDPDSVIAAAIAEAASVRSREEIAPRSNAAEA